MPARPLGLVCALALAVALLATGAPVRAQVPSSVDKQQAYLDLLEAFLPFAQRFWRDSDLPQPDTGHYDAAGEGVTQARGAGNVALATATLLVAEPHRDSFAGVARGVLVDRVRQTIRHSALTSALADTGHNRWGGDAVQASLEAFGWGLAAHLLWAELDPPTRDVVSHIVSAQADAAAAQPIFASLDGQTGAEKNGWNTLMPALAATMLPDDERRPRWREAVTRAAVNASARAADTTDDLRVDGRPLHDWVVGANLHPDLTVEHHGFFNPTYQVVPHLSLEHAAVVTAMGDRPLAEALSFRTEEIWEAVTAGLVTEDGDLLMPQGQDWFARDYQHLGYLAGLATRFGRSDAAVSEARALAGVRARQAARGDGTVVGLAALGYESMLAQRWALAWWSHELFGPAPAPAAGEGTAGVDGTVQTFDHVATIVGRFPSASVSMSWHGGDPHPNRQDRPMGLVVPHGAGAPPVDYGPRSLVGDATGPVGEHSWTVGRDGFATAGTIGDRRFAMSAFADGTTMLLDRGRGATFRLAFHDLPGLPSPHPVGTGTAGPASWANVAGHLGMVVTGGAALTTATVGADHSRRLVVTGSDGTGAGERGAVLWPGADAETTRQLAAGVTPLAAPEDWSGLVARAPDGSLRLAAARWGGPDAATLELRDDRGAPLTRAPAAVHGPVARVQMALGAPAAHGEAVRFFAAAEQPLLARATSDGRARLANPSDHPVAVTVTGLDRHGEAHTTAGTVPAGGRAEAVLRDGVLTVRDPRVHPAPAGPADHGCAPVRAGHPC